MNQARDEAARLRPAFRACLFAVTVLGFFVTYRVYNDHFDRLARAYQMVAFGDVPFRDFFDPGYFLTLYASALVQRLLGHNLLGELLLNVLAMSAGATLAAVLVSRVAGASRWGVIADILVVAAQPRPYDYDKVLFFPLGLSASWWYADQPDRRHLMIAAGIPAIAGLFRYDSGIYLFSTLIVTIIVRHWSHPREAARQIGGAVLTAVAVLAPAAVFVQRTAGIGAALTQMRTYAAREGGNGHLFEPPAFAIDWHAPMVSANAWLPGFATRQNAGAWLYVVATILPLLVLSFQVRSRHQRDRAGLAQLVAYVTLAELLAMFILRNPVTARVGALVPILTVGAAYVVRALRDRWHETVMDGAGRRRALASFIVAGSLGLLTGVSIFSLVEMPSRANLDVATRLEQFAAVPPSLDLWPDPPYLPVVRYIRACTKPEDRVFAAWFFSELYYFTDRGFAGGLPVLFEKHWSELPYQRRSLELLQSQSVPIILTTRSKDLRSYEFLWSFINREYRSVKTPLPPAFPDIVVWVRRDILEAGQSAEIELPCYTNGRPFVP